MSAPSEVLRALSPTVFDVANSRSRPAKCVHFCAPAQSVGDALATIELCMDKVKRQMARHTPPRALFQCALVSRTGPNSVAP